MKWLIIFAMILACSQGNKYTDVANFFNEDFILNLGTAIECGNVTENQIDAKQIFSNYDYSLSLKENLEIFGDINYNLRCLGKCYAVKKGMVNANRTKFDYELYKKQYMIKDKNFKEIADKCTLYNNQKDACDRNHAINKCIWAKTEPGVFKVPLVLLLLKLYASAKNIDINEVIKYCTSQHPSDYKEFSNLDVTAMRKENPFYLSDISHSQRCYDKCFIVKIGIMKPDRSKFNYELYKAMFLILDEDNIKEIVDKCTYQNQQKDDCDRNHEINKCIAYKTIYKR